MYNTNEMFLKSCIYSIEVYIQYEHKLLFIIIPLLFASNEIYFFHKLINWSVVNQCLGAIFYQSMNLQSFNYTIDFVVKLIIWN